jgi:hypothetical protein
MEIIMNKNMWLRMMVIVFMSISATMMLSSCGGGGGDEDAEAREEIVVDEDEDSSAEIIAEEAEVEAEEASADIAGVWNGTRSSIEGSTSIQIDFNQSGSALVGTYQDRSLFLGDIEGFINNEDEIEFSLTLTSIRPGNVWEFSGELSEDGSTISGAMTASSGDFDILLTR